MNILDIGSGAGDVALLLADLVGPGGSVTGVDVNGEILETARERVHAAGWTNVDFLQGDAHTIELDRSFDAVVGRWVLMYLPERVALLRRLQSYLRPGATVAFQEIDFTYPPAAFPAGPLHQQLQRWMTPPPGRGGPDGNMGLTLFQAYLDAGFCRLPQLRLDAPLGGGADWPGYAYVADTFSSLLPRLEQMGVVTAEEAGIETLADRWRAEVVPTRRADAAADRRRLGTPPAIAFGPTSETGDGGAPP